MDKQLRATLMWSVVSLLMILHFFLMLSVGVITSQLRDSLNISALQLSFLASAYLYIYLLLQTPAGILSDQYGARKLLSLGSIGCAVGCWMFAHSNNLAFAMLARMLMGSSLAFVFISSVQLASRWFAARYFGLMIGLAEGTGMAGVIAGNMLLAYFIQRLGWRASFEIAAGVALLLAVLSWLWIHDYPNPHISHVKAKDKLTFKKVKSTMRILVREPQVWLQSAYISLMYTAVTVFSGLWANPFLRKAFNMGIEQSTFACSLVLAGVGLASPVVGIFCHTRKAQIQAQRLCAIVMLILYLILLYVPILSNFTIYLIMFALGVCASGIIFSFAIVSDIAPEGAKSTSVGFTNALSFTAVIICQPLIGWILNCLAEKSDANSMEVYSAMDYRIALTVLPVCVLLALIASVFIHINFRSR